MYILHSVVPMFLYTSRDFLMFLIHREFLMFILHRDVQIFLLYSNFPMFISLGSPYILFNVENPKGKT
jgi:hypothetical protein